jgi:uncharacterized membrane protein
MRSFDPRRVGALECETWVTYYRRQWWPFLRAAVAVVRHAFGLPWHKTVYGAWLVLRANQLWAPADNDPDGARRCMRRFYALVAGHHGESIDVAEAAHRECQHGLGQDDIDERALVDALAALYAHVYAVAPADVQLAAAQRALAMRHSDAWVAAGCPEASTLVEQERAALVRSYAALLAAVHRT